MTLDLSDRGTLEELMRDPWLNMGQEEGLRSQQSPCDNMDPWVTEVMMNLGFEQDQIQGSIIDKRYDRAMSTYSILRTEKPQGGGPHHQSKILLFPSPDFNSHSPSLTQRV